MGRLNQVKIGVDALTEARLTVRAQQAGATLSEYVRGLIVRDLSRTDGGSPPPPTDRSPSRSPML